MKTKLTKMILSSLAFACALVAVTSLFSVQPAQAGYIVTLQQVGPNVVATGSGAINLTGLTFSQSGSVNPSIRGARVSPVASSFIYTGPTSSSVDSYFGATGPMSFGGWPFITYWTASSGSGDMVGISAGFLGVAISVPTGYVSDTALSDTATYSGTTLERLHVTPGTYVWKWGAGANQNFTLKIGTAVSPRLSNISTRGFVQTGNNVMIGGFIIEGTGAKTVILRAIGPELAAPPFNIPNALADPTVELHNGSGALIARNDNWQTTIVGGIIAASQVSAIQNSGHAPTHPTESAIIATLQPAITPRLYVA